MKLHRKKFLHHNTIWKTSVESLKRAASLAISDDPYLQMVRSIHLNKHMILLRSVISWVKTAVLSTNCTDKQRSQFYSRLWTQTQKCSLAWVTEVGQWISITLTAMMYSKTWELFFSKKSQKAHTSCCLNVNQPIFKVLNVNVLQCWVIWQLMFKINTYQNYQKSSCIILW